MSKPITIYDRRGREIEMPSIKKAAREMGVSENLLRRRINDGLWIHREGYVPVRVKVE